MMRFIGWLATVAVVVGGVAYVQHALTRAAPVHTDPVVHVTRPTIHIDQVKKLAALVTLEVPISDVQVSEISGLTGSIRLAVAVHGDVAIATDLGAARFENIDDLERTAIVVLPRPSPTRPRLDHDKTRIIEIQRTGMWQILLGQAGESALTNRALAAAQNALAQAADDPEIAKKACAHTEAVIHNFFAALGWDVTVQWAEG